MTERFRIIETGWRTDGLFVVTLGGGARELLESKSAHEYACIIAARRRCKTPVMAEPVRDPAESLPFSRTFCFLE